MENRLDLVGKGLARLDAGDEIFLVHVVGNFAIGDILKLDAVFQIVHHQNVTHALLIQGFDDVAADKAGAACHNNHVFCLFFQNIFNNVAGRVTFDKIQYLHLAAIIHHTTATGDLFRPVIAALDQQIGQYSAD